MEALTVNNGVKVPALGLGVFQTLPDETRDAVRAALRAGYSLIDTATAYGNERQVGEAVHDSGLDRSDVFLETQDLDQRLRIRRDATRLREERSQARRRPDRAADPVLGAAVGVRPDLAAYRALETLLADGKIRAIGVSNFMVEHLTKLLDRATAVPAVNQIEVPLLHAARSAGLRRRARHPHAGLVTDRRHHLLPRR